MPVKVDWSWLVILALVFFSLATGLFPSAYPALSTLTCFLMAAAATLLFFASVLVHELSHTLRSLREGVPVRDITLWLFGGVSRAEEPLPGPGAEFRVVIAGPLASAALAVVFLAVAAAGHALGLSDAWTGVPDYLARINGLLLVFNIVPALPLDGGRLLHALIWHRTGDTATATIYAAWAGRAFAVVLVTLGVASLFGAYGYGGIWFVLIGWFLWQAVRQEEGEARTARALAGLRVKDVMTPAAVTVDVGSTIEEFGDLIVRTPSYPAYPVLDQGRFVGLLLLRRAGVVPMEERRSVRVGDVMLTGEDVPVVHEDDEVTTAARTLGREPGRAIVLSDGAGREVVGLVSTSDLSRAVATPPRGRARPRAHRAGDGTS
ncbi:site-2 protease family protein [Nocardioides mesophilus]|uniref:Zinc metalloprotease n=1 Tax=Nocardioides mesophilus TaxID=433659 RepID=A0A7G9RB22_9ACTN|nr:site-2 protease family protein [Nocardioides mesophilus]QNN52797.1 site-2 protease family protein [Nocardioides mesophilus]